MINIFVNDVKGMFYLLTSSITIRKEVTILPSPVESQKVTGLIEYDGDKKASTDAI